ncbi:MAG TPA: TraM recognition domain-containing protein [Candidatus Absconditabacterales bacterium]|nr:TraM recognition domain-containing protein [Candidatus Absconditabacterales bacterium]
MISAQECSNLLKEQFQTNFSQKENVSQLMTNARKENKTECFQHFGSIGSINSYLTNIENNYEQISTENKTVTSDSDLVKTSDHKETHSAAPTQESNILEGFSIGLKTIGMYVLYAIIGIIAIKLIFNLIRCILRRGYAFLNNNRLVYMKVLTPKGDSKMDREQAKEIAKDMKEKIGRMTQVYMNMSKLGSLTIKDKIMYSFFRKPRIVFLYHYEDGTLNFIIGCFPEYKKIIEGSIGSQYPSSSIETIKKPNIFKRKHYKVMPLQSEKDEIYTLKDYKKMGDDPINNIVDAMDSVSRYDTATVIMTIKPMPEKRNKKAMVKIDKLHKGLEISKNPLKKIGNFFKFILTGTRTAQKKAEDITMVRMVKSKEDTINYMGEEVGGAAFEAGLMLVTTSDEKNKLKDNIEGLISAYNVYTDEYGNELRQLENKAGLLNFISKPLRTIAAKYKLTNLFFHSNIFTLNELTGLFHFPDKTYNRSSIINWMEYKILPAPSNLPILDPKDATDYIISGILAEKYKGGKVEEILKEYKNHRAVGKKTVEEEKLEPIEKFKQSELKDKETVEKDGKKFVKTKIKKDVYGYKVFKSGVLLGTNIYRNKYVPVYMKRNDRTRHHYCIGKSGTGKSVYLQTLARQDIWNGDGVCIIDPHGDLIEDLLQYIPKERAKDVVVFDAGNDERPMGLNLYEINNLDEADRTVNDATEIFIKMFGPEIFGPRIQEYFKYGSLTILEDFEDRPTILDVVRLYTDESFRQYKVSKVTNPIVKNFWEKTYNAMGDREKAEIIPYFSSKFVSFNTNRLIRNIIGQTKSAFDLEDIMNNKKILLINLSKGKIGDMNAQLLGMILVSKVYNAAMSRAKIPEKDRKDFYLYVDEFQNFVSGTFADILSEARKYRLCLIMAHQYIAQLEAGQGLNKSEGGKGDVKAAVFGNVGTMQSFKVGAPDAEFLEKEYQPVLGSGDISGIANYKAYIKLNIDNSTTRPFSMNSIYTMDYRNKKIPDILKEYSAKKYGRKRKFVDAEITARLGLDLEEVDKQQAQGKEIKLEEVQKQKPESNKKEKTTNNKK